MVLYLENIFDLNNNWHCHGLTSLPIKNKLCVSIPSLINIKITVSY